MPKSPERFFNLRRVEEPKEPMNSPPITEKEERALELVEKIKSLKAKPKTEITLEDYQRIIELYKEIESLFSPEKKRNPIKMEKIPETEVKVGGWVRSVAISPDGKFAIIGSTSDHKARLARITKDNQGYPIKMEIIPETEVEVGGRVWSTAISPDGKFATIGSASDHKARLARITKDNQGNPIKMEIIPETEVEVGGGVFSTAISPDGNFVIIGSTSDHKARLARITKDNQGNPIKMEEIPETKVEVGGGVYSTAISPDGNFVIIGGGAAQNAILARIIFEEQE